MRSARATATFLGRFPVAQVRISLINTTFTAVYVAVVVGIGFARFLGYMRPSQVTAWK